MRYYAVLDTNVLVSALIKPRSVPSAVVAEAMNGTIIPLFNNAILTEYEDVLSRRKFRFDKSDIHALMDGIIQRGLFVDAEPLEAYIPDPKDVVFYQVTMEKRKTDETYLITGNTKHFPTEQFVVTPREMLDIIYNRVTPPQES